nr:MAG TPA: helix-turn-helix domain protein [Caudoviricetes sp.]
MRDFGSISPVEAMQDLGCMRLGARIFELKQAGHAIRREMETGKNRYGETTSYARYRLDDG